jgi:hypothetical protein
MAMRAKYPQFNYRYEKNGDITFKGVLKVKPEIPDYHIKIVYRPGGSPQIFVLKPVPVDDAPHIYRNSGSLCLYHPADYHWEARKLIADDIMGWTAGWIYFYEYWLQTGEWIGPAAHH